jgi:endonuclease YncB( thermonuclease family)
MLTFSAVLAAALLFPLKNSEASSITEYPSVTDGDTIQIRTVSLRLAGIDAPELGQMCMGADHVEWDCGVAAKRLLTEKIGGGAVSCGELYLDNYGRLFGTCVTRDGDDLSASMVLSGYALACGPRYLNEEKAAHLARNGMWSGSFQTPWEWLAQQPDHDKKRRNCEDIDCLYLSNLQTIEAERSQLPSYCQRTRTGTSSD